MFPLRYSLYALVLLAFTGVCSGAGPTTIPTMPAKQTVDLCSDAPPIKVIKWLKGSPIESFKPGKVYVVEFWATWCVPCREAMPHLTEMAKKFGDKVTFIGVDVWEQPDDAPDDKICSMVDTFLTKIGDRMGYTVAADGSDHFMFDNWLLAAHRMNIPSTFIIGQDGKVAWIGHPLEMEPVLQKVVAGTWDARAELTRLQKERDAAKRFHDLMLPSFEAMQGNDCKTALSRVEAVIATNPDLAADLQVIMLKFECLMQTDQNAAMAYLKTLYGDKEFQANPVLAYSMAQTAMKDSTSLGHGDYILLISAMDVGRKDDKNNSKNFMFMPTYAEALFRDGQIDKAAQCQQQLIIDATPNIGQVGVTQGWVDFQVKKLHEYKASLNPSSATQPAARSSDQILKEITEVHPTKA